MSLSCGPLARSIAGVLCASLALTLMGAATTYAPAPPTLVIFPFRYAEGLDPQSGTQYVAKLGTALSALGGVKVVMADPATAPADYLHTTKADGGDYYLIGYVAPPVNSVVSVIEQLVSARSGTVVWSDTAHVSASGSDDILAQGPVLKNALLARENRGYLAIVTATPKPAPTPTPAPQKKVAASTGGGGAPGTERPPLKLPNEAYGFSSQPTAPPKVYASAGNPSRFVVLTIAGKTVPAVVRQYTVSSLVSALKRHGQSVAEGDPAATEGVPGPNICTQTGARYLVFGSVSATSVPRTVENNFTPWTDALFNVAAYDCGAGKFAQAAKPLHGGAGVWQSAVDKATNAAVTDYLLKVVRVATSS